MKEITADKITQAVSDLFRDVCYHLPDDVTSVLVEAKQSEKSPVARNVIERILENARIGDRGVVPLCQDTGMAVVFLEIGQDVHIVGGDLTEGVNEGVRLAYGEGYLRKSVVTRPFSERVNTKDNTPAIIHTSIVPGDRLKITALSKGFGSENMSRMAMLVPAVGRQGVIDFVTDCVDKAGPNPCPPVIVGVGIGGTAEKCMLIAKKALMRQIGESHEDPEVAELEGEILERVNDLGIGAMGYGGTVTALAVHIEVFPTHIASLPVAVNLQCHSARHKEITL
ncbi:MAG: fumarate hydratase [Deltaproteobacteria bacterium]|nr:fumarate hydratase [Deltaproteobacteria bacterium]